LEFEGFQIELVLSGQGALDRARANRYDAVVLDLHLPDMFGLTVLDRLDVRNSHAAILVITGCYGEEEMERNALKAGATAFRRKPLFCDDIATVLKSMVVRRTLTATPHPTERGLAPEELGLDTDSPSVAKLARWIARVGPSSAPVLITGESGVGKELVARRLYRASSRRRTAFVPVNCGAIPDGLMESELFGHTKGAFTGAVADKPGLLEAAHNGTLFLDEVAELPASMQVRFLRALEDGEIRRVGETQTRHVDVRIIAATNRSLATELVSGRFREDLYFRLAVATYHIPPLRERPEDIEPLARYWLKQMATREHMRVSDISPAALSLLRTYHWPGNVRELRNVLQHSIVLAAGPTLTESEIADALSTALSAARKTSDRPDANVNECLTALEAHHWNHSKAARSLGIDRTTLWRRLKRIAPPQGSRHG
jgi:DNA-binding NtrC family response regulator